MQDTSGFDGFVQNIKKILKNIMKNAHCENIKKLLKFNQNKGVLRWY
jgi:hypothetical protein